MKDADIWNPLLRAKFIDRRSDLNWRVEFDQVLGDCGALTDLPAYYFCEELIAAYPEAKVLIVERDVNAWMRSYDPLFKSVWDPWFKILAFLDPRWLGRMLPLNAVPTRAYFRATNEDEQRANAPAVYREHYQRIKELVPKERLLEYELGSGWEPMCKFLGKPMPDEPFPHINENVALQDWIDLVSKNGVLNVLKNLALGASSVGAVVFALRWILN